MKRVRSRSEPRATTVGQQQSNVKQPKKVDTKTEAGIQCLAKKTVIHENVQINRGTGKPRNAKLNHKFIHMNNNATVASKRKNVKNFTVNKARELIFVIKML